MPKLDRLRYEPPAAWQAGRLARWLNEWQLDQALASVEPPPAASQPDDTNPHAPAEPADELPATAGQVRLLKPRTEAMQESPVFIAILPADKADRLTCIPFGRFSEPATPGEILTGRTSPVLRVLCLWLARDISANLLNETWLVDELTDLEMHTLTTALASVRHCNALPEHLCEQGGPPFIHPEDPRHLYLRRERIRLTRTLPPASESNRPLRYPARDESTSATFLRAAEETEEYHPE